MRLSLFACALFVLAACDGTTVDATAFDQSCKVAADCEPVINGSVCGCVCPTAAIDTADMASYAQAEEAAERHCPPIDYDCVACKAVTVACEQGTCEVR